MIHHPRAPLCAVGGDGVVAGDVHVIPRVAYADMVPGVIHCRGGDEVCLQSDGAAKREIGQRVGLTHPHAVTEETVGVAVCLTGWAGVVVVCGRQIVV